MHSQFVIFDTECTTWEDALETGWEGEGQHPEIAQFGAVRVSDEFDVVATLDILVRPVRNPTLSKFFMDLTGITQEAVDKVGVSFQAGYAHFLTFCGDDAVICNGWDCEGILENLELNGLAESMPLVDAVNIRPWLESKGIPREDQASGRLADYFGLHCTTERQPHDGLYDSESIRLTLRHLFLQGRDVRPIVEREQIRNRARKRLPLRELIASQREK